MKTSQTAHALSIDERHALNMDQFSQALGQSRLWHLLPEGVSDIQSSIGLFDKQTGLIYPPAAALSAFLNQHPFVFVQTLDGKYQATLQSKNKILWNNEASGTDCNVSDGKRVVSEGRWAGEKGWLLPTTDMLRGFAMDMANPHREGPKYYLKQLKSQSSVQSDGTLGNLLSSLVSAFGNGRYWLTENGRCDVADGYWGVESSSTGRVFACHTRWRQALDKDMLTDLIMFGWSMAAPDGATFSPGPRWQGLTDEAIHTACLAEGLHLRAHDKDDVILDPRSFAVLHQSAVLDYKPCRLPKLDNAQLTDPEKGLWEFWGEDEAVLKRFGLVARDPGRDLQHRAVAIDFGTSSTVVAMDTASGGRELLRIGVRDFYQPVQAQQFENPTVLECLDLMAFHRDWGDEPYRPPLDWNAMRAAHEAQASFRDNPGDTRVLASILPRLKQWALRSERMRVRLADRKGLEIELAPHSERNPVRGQPLTVTPEDPFDPIELYAWYLGMAINWRGRGLFLKYYLSFPVKYPREVKERILASFRRGLQRSLPPSLIHHHPQVLNEFEVTGWASEPAAYAAAALPHLGLEATDDGLPYAVFDFGGGTTDFDFGLLRWASPEEEAQGYERVFEHLASSGDNFLGGENLLEHLVYESFQHNLSVLRENRIQFTRPIDASPFDGSEAFLAQTQAAQTNTVMLAAKLRPFLESATPDLSAQIKLDLIDANGSKKPCELALDAQHLDALLACRIRGGVEAFLAELARLREKLPSAAPIHILLAGNGSRSRHINAIFDLNGDLWRTLLANAFDDTPPEIVVHAPLPLDESNAHAPTAKTGVALGLLRLVPGENTLLLDHVHDRHDGQAPFAWFVGRLRRGRFEPVLSHGAIYKEWQELGPLQQGVFNLFATTSLRAHQGLSEGHPELKKHRLDFPAASPGSKLFARATSPHELELAAVLDKSDLASSAVAKFVLE